MVEEQSRREKYLQELDEAIKELNAAYAEYDNIRYLINLDKMSDDEKEYFKNVVNKVRLFETHAYIRLKTVEKDFDKKHNNILEGRVKLKVTIPKEEDVEALVLAYNKIQAKELEGDKFFKNL